ncbi:PLC-like phosphodiesterase, partial [Bisporella sp. PMI_857]
TASQVSVSTISQAALSTSTTACNNSPELCNRNYNNITHIGAHDSFALRDSSTGFSVSGNQFYNATLALSAGIRMLQVQAHVENGTIRLCHTTCSLLDGGTLETFLGNVKVWMDANPNEVVTLLVVNSDDADASDFGQVFASSGISTYGYTPESTSGPIATWPTLQTLITANTRLITFIASIDYDSSYPYLLSEFDFVFETAFGVTDYASFTCELDRPTSLDSSSAAVSAGYMGLLNHFKDTKQAFFDIPDVANITITNSPNTTTIGAAGLHGRTCSNEWGVKPTFILVDFWNVGPSIETADLLNGVTGMGRTSASTSVLTQSSATA